MAILPINGHVERTIAAAEIRDRDALRLRSWLQRRYGNLHKRRAGVGGENVLRLLALERDERSHRRIRFPAAMRAMINLNARSFGTLGREWKGNHAQVRRELFIR